jgi:hypothetical protein
LDGLLPFENDRIAKILLNEKGVEPNAVGYVFNVLKINEVKTTEPNGENTGEKVEINTKLYFFNSDIFLSLQGE